MRSWYTKKKNEWVSNYLVLKQIKQTQIFIIWHYNDVINGTIASQITSLTIVTQPFIQAQIKEKNLSFASLPFVREFHRRPVNSSLQMASNAENASIWWRHHKVWLSCNIQWIGVNLFNTEPKFVQVMALYDPWDAPFSDEQCTSRPRYRMPIDSAIRKL